MTGQSKAPRLETGGREAPSRVIGRGLALGPSITEEGRMNEPTDTPRSLPGKDVPRECRRWRKGDGWVWKTRYISDAAARLNAGNGQAVYECSHCGCWHKASLNSRAPLENP